MSVVTLEPYTLVRCQLFFREYVPDPAMLDGDFSVDEEWVRRYYGEKVQAPDRRFFAVCLEGHPIGEISLKHIDWAAGTGELSIHFSRDEYKNRGFGTQAERLLLEKAFTEWGLTAVTADCLHRNVRSRHVLEKVGFRPVSRDQEKEYFILTREIYQGGAYGTPDAEAHRPY